MMLPLTLVQEATENFAQSNKGSVLKPIRQLDAFPCF